jgi:hypothetical protein
MPPFGESSSSTRRRLAKVVPSLTAEESDAFLAGDVAALSGLGGNRYLMMGLARNRLFGLDEQSYVARLRAAYEQDPEGRSDISPSPPKRAVS